MPSTRERTWHVPATGLLNVALGWTFTFAFTLAFTWVGVDVFGTTAPYTSDPQLIPFFGQAASAVLVLILLGANLAWQGAVTGFRWRLWAVAVPAFLLPSVLTVVLPALGRG